MRTPSTRPLTALGILCLLDWAWTVAHLVRGIPEANPLLALAFEAGGLALFSIVKLGATGAALAVLTWQREHRLVRRLVPWCVLAYTLVLGVHVAVEAIQRL